MNASTAGWSAVPEQIHIVDLRPVPGRYGIRTYWVPFCTCKWESQFKWIDLDDANDQAKKHLSLFTRKRGLK